MFEKQKIFTILAIIAVILVLGIAFYKISFSRFMQQAQQSVFFLRLPRLLYPERVKAIAAGGCTHSLPFAEYGGENLPYPIGTYDYQTITGHAFDEQTFSAIPRYLYKGDHDPGGTETVDGITYPASEYFELFIKTDLEARVEASPSPIVRDANMTYAEEEAIKYRIYHGAVFVEEFKAVRGIYADAGLVNTQFKLYPGVGHEVPDEMREDVVMFLGEVME